MGLAVDEAANKLEIGIKRITLRCSRAARIRTERSLLRMRGRALFLSLFPVFCRTTLDNIYLYANLGLDFVYRTTKDDALRILCNDFCFYVLDL